MVIATVAVAFLTVALATLIQTSLASERSPSKSRRVAIAYVEPKNPEHRAIYELLKARQALKSLEHALKLVRLPRQLTLQVEGCDGVANAFYEDAVVSVCYEYLAEILRNAPIETTLPGIAPEDAIIGPFIDVFLHEVGHALIDLLELPVLGREEDAADQISGFIMLQQGKDEAKRLIAGAAYHYRKDMQFDTISVPLKEFSDEHGHPAQRFYNLLCIAYGSDTKLFAEIVDWGFLPRKRAEGCKAEYEQIAHAFEKLIAPHVEPALRKKMQLLR